MPFLFVSTGDCYQTPYIEAYESCFEGEYDFLYWSRGDVSCRIARANAIPYKSKGESKLDKLTGYAGFCSFAKDCLRKKNYDGIVLLQTQAALLLSSYLKRHYQEKYICDIRDYCFEKLPFVRGIEKSLFGCSYANFISSPGYAKFLPSGVEYHLLHNNHPGLYRSEPSSAAQGPINIVFLGSIRFHDQCRKLIKAFSNDERFRVSFVGAGALALKNTCGDLDIEGVSFQDSFYPSQTVNLLEGADLLFNLYGNNSPFLDYALSNKLYYAAELGKPILVCPNTFMEEITLEYGLGFSVDLEREDASTKLLEEYSRFDFRAFDEGRHSFIEKVSRENDDANRLMKAFFANE